MCDMAHTYEVVTLGRAGEHTHRYTTDDELAPGAVLRLGQRDWLIASVDDGVTPPRALAKRARYRIRLEHPEGRHEDGAFRRFQPGSPRLGHSFSTIEDGQPVSWEIVEERLAFDQNGEPYLELIARRDFGEDDAALARGRADIPDHELEHALAALEDDLPEGAAAYLARAEQQGLSIELVSLEPGEVPDWEEAARYIDALILPEIGEDMLEHSGIHPGRDPQEKWLGVVKERLHTDLAHFRRDIEDDHDEIEVWEFRDGRIFAAVGTYEHEADPDSPYGWLVRLVDASALGAAGFVRVRKAELFAP